MEKIIKERDKALELLSGKLEGFYLAGGTALSTFYFHHRESFDLDFFTKDFSRTKIEKIATELSKSSGLKIELASEQNQKGMARMLVYSLKIDKDNELKIDFIEDVFDLIKAPKIVDGIPVLSIEDIYLRKIFAACGVLEISTDVGKKVFTGGRQEAKDFFDLYFLSNTFKPLSKFAALHCNAAQIESIVVWYRRYGRMPIKLGLNDIRTDKKVNFQDMERHFRKEVEGLLKEEL
ncbi:MAG: nucleotidyl transferase AbiEii/AbiGii toxin family protein [bacterium]|nr:nucleotidyl transferase AbiEii/AbiGii toxin family protein [bacterium]